jgi:hypothetical protein
MEYGFVVGSLVLIFKFLCICQLVHDLFIGTTIRIYNMDLEFDGIYRIFLISEVIIPTEQAQFISLVPVLESFFNVKVSDQRLSLVSKVQTLNAFLFVI